MYWRLLLTLKGYTLCVENEMRIKCTDQVLRFENIDPKKHFVILKVVKQKPAGSLYFSSNLAIKIKLNLIHSN